jgi:hypothetical protein
MTVLDKTDAFTLEGDVALRAVDLIEGSSLARRVDIQFPGQVTEFVPLGISNWSSGERALWDTLNSLAGHGPVDLHRTASCLGGTRTGAALGRVMCEALGWAHR